MPSVKFDKTFTPQEANELLPRLELMLRQLTTQANFVRERVHALAEQNSGAGTLEQLTRDDPAVRQAVETMARLSEQVENLGCFLKDIDMGLVDFPAEVEGELVFLCWQSGEPQVVAWHPLDQGFANRRSLPGSRKVILN